ncbi:MAG: hypothetical protein R8F63_19930 [Acidimicrobiales bacterium]|nr:hypothetical protein [Acidimicrobiales bacterium]
MFTSVIVSVLVLGAGFIVFGRRPPAALQPATVVRVTGTARRVTRIDVLRTAPVDDENSIVMDSLRAIGLVRKRVDQPVVGKKAYVRMWERVRAIIVLAVIIITLGVLLATVVGLFFLALGFLLEQAIG